VEKPIVQSRAAVAKPVPAPKTKIRPESVPSMAKPPTLQREVVPTTESAAATPSAPAGPAASGSGAGSLPGVLRVDAVMLANK